jgi:hypothetical protein
MQPQPRRAALIAAMSIFFISIIASNARLAAAVSGSVTALLRAIGVDLPGQSPFVLAPAARTLFAAVADNRVPVTISFRLVSGCDLKRECFVVLECRSAIEPEAGNPHHGKFDRSHLLAASSRPVEESPSPVDPEFFQEERAIDPARNSQDWEATLNFALKWALFGRLPGRYRGLG